MLSLEKVRINSKTHIKILFNLLLKKDYNISHQKNPNFEEHQNFVKKNRYRKWYLILDKNKYIGTTYITYSNVIGINIISYSIKNYKDVINLMIKNHKPLKAIKSERSAYFIINSNPKNNILKKTLKELNFYHIENSYAFIKD